MFYNCSALTGLDVSSFNTARATSMKNMFYACSSLTSLDVSRFRTDNSTDPYTWDGMFINCSGLESLSVSSSLASTIRSNIFSGVGTTGSPCALTYPAGTVIQKEETGPGWFLWRGGYFADAPSFLLGDVNSDDKITIADVTALVNIILGKDDGPTPMYNHDAADVNKDNKVTIADVTALVNVILGK